MGAAVPYEGVDGVVGAWYGKGPGLDRCGDVLKHANFMGTGPHGGAVLFVGDDPTAKSSTLPYDTNAPLADAAVPILVPADQQDLLDLAVEAFRLSRACGSWVGVRVVTAVADGIGAVDAVARPLPRRGARRWWSTASRGATSRAGRSCGPTWRRCGSTGGCGPRAAWVEARGLDRDGRRRRPRPPRDRVRRAHLPRRARRARAPAASGGTTWPRPASGSSSWR